MAEGPSERREGFGAGNIQVLAVCNIEEGEGGSSKHRCSGGGRHFQCQETVTIAAGKSQMGPWTADRGGLECGQLWAVYTGEPLNGGWSPQRGHRQALEYSHHFFLPGAR